MFLQHTLVETSARVCDGNLGDSEPHHRVRPLIRSAQAFLHGAMEVWHGVGYRWDIKTGSRFLLLEKGCYRCVFYRT